MKDNENDDIKISLGTAVLIVALFTVFFIVGIVWISLKTKGLI